MTEKRAAGERRIVTVLFCDVVGSTTIAEEMDPEDWTEIVANVVAQMAAHVEHWGGTVAQFAGDSILALFGAPSAHEDDPYRAVRAGLDIVETLHGSPAAAEGASADIAVRVGIHTGLVVVGDVAAGDLNLYTALGDTTNVAARIETLAAPGTVLISEDTRRLLGDDVFARDLGRADVRGRSDGVGVFEVTGAREVDERGRGIPGLQSPMVGRGSEFAALLDQLARARDGSVRFTALVGDPGVGKSRLIEELQKRVTAAGGGRWAVGRSVPYDQHRPYQLIASLLRGMADVSDADGPEASVKAIEGLGDPVFGPDRPQTGYLLQLMGLEEGHADDDPVVLRAHYESALAELIRGVATECAPLVLICEDVHWSDASSAELLASVLSDLGDAPVLVVAATRPDPDARGWALLSEGAGQLGDAFAEMRLQALDDAQSRELVANLLAIESLPEHVRRAVLEKADGNPFFLEEVVRMLVDRELIEEVDGRWVAAGDIGDLEVPATLHGLLASRLDLVPAGARQTGMVASVIGRRFEVGLLGSVAAEATGPEAASELLADLGRLEAQGLIEVAGAQPSLAFAFRHALIHDVTYTSILKRERQRLHGVVARIIETRQPDRAGENAPTLARHYQEAGDDAKTLEYLLLAGRTAMRRHAMIESRAFFAEAAALIEADSAGSPRLRVEVALELARAGMQFTPGNETIAVIEGVRADVEALGEPDLLAEFYALLLGVRTLLEESYADGPFREVMDLAFALAPQVESPALRARLEGMMGHVYRTADEYERALELLSGSVPVLVDAGRVSEAATNSMFAGDVEATRGDFAASRRWIETSMALAEESDNPNIIADADLIMGKIAATRGDLEDALVYTRRGTATAERVGNIQCTLVGNFLAADQELRLGNAESAIPHLERSFELGEFCNAEAMVALGQAWLASAQAKLGQADASAFSAPLEAATTMRTRSGEAAVRLHRAIALAASSDPDWPLTFADFERAIELFTTIGARPDQARALHAYGMALEVAGRQEESADAVATAMGMFEDMGISPDPGAGSGLASQGWLPSI